MHCVPSVIFVLLLSFPVPIVQLIDTNSFSRLVSVSLTLNKVQGLNSLHHFTVMLVLCKEILHQFIEIAEFQFIVVAAHLMCAF